MEHTSCKLAVARSFTYNGSSERVTRYDWVRVPTNTSSNISIHRHQNSGHSGSGAPAAASLHDNEVVVPDYPSCESFDFKKTGNTGTQTAGVFGIWDIVTRFGKCPGIGAAASYQTYYFHVPAHWSQGYAATRSAGALASAFYDLNKWFERQPCNQAMFGQLAIKMDEYIKEAFREIGGQANRSAPLGWSGTVRTYVEDFDGTD